MESNSTTEPPSGTSTPVTAPGTPAATAAMPAPATTSVTKPTASMWFTSEIQQMMHGFGDCRKPLLESAVLIEKIVRQHLTTALYKAEDIAKQRNARFIGIEDFLFLMRKDKVKLKRLIKYMELKDLKKMSFKTDDDVDCNESDSRPHSKKRSKICFDFLNNIDQTGELMAVFEDDSCLDEIKYQRALRAELMSRGMDTEQYLDFCDARQISFVARYKSQKFRDWVLQGITLDVKPNPLAVETLSYLAYETVAQVMDLALMVKRDMTSHQEDPLSKIIPHITVNYDVLQSPKQKLMPPPSTTTPGSANNPAVALKSPQSMPSSPLNSPPSTPTTPNTSNLMSSLNASGGSSKSKTSKKKKKLGALNNKDLHNSQAITAAHLREAMRRYSSQMGPFGDFVQWTKVPKKSPLLCF